MSTRIKLAVHWHVERLWTFSHSTRTQNYLLFFFYRWSMDLSELIATIFDDVKMNNSCGNPYFSTFNHSYTWSSQGLWLLGPHIGQPKLCVDKKNEVKVYILMYAKLSTNALFYRKSVQERGRNLKLDLKITDTSLYMCKTICVDISFHDISVN